MSDNVVFDIYEDLALVVPIDSETYGAFVCLILAATKSLE